ncbi:MAG: hypothetical protein KBF99_05290 [Leptospiraceae bacterium]|nr:hypothetical protein [Leptospiraceae bacterium]MBK7056375.1 hypothetical protein [Leptospiraceae bacterium]MBK9503766.1 hypothetical protein [Leptospiraceae bacterium]MBP9162573.1 hypothetical protein [Leptospiraceae bacterium]
MNQIWNNSKPIRLVFFILAFSFCAYNGSAREQDNGKLSQSKDFPVLRNQKQMIKILSEDRILREILCDSIAKHQIGNCANKTDFNAELITNQKTIQVDVEISNNSSDYFVNAGKSLVTLTLGVFLSNSAEFRFRIQTSSSDKEILTTKEIDSFSRIERWGILPFYAGFAATNFGTLLNTYRNPIHLKNYCLKKPVSDLRKILEATREDYCEEYEAHLKDSFLKVEKEIVAAIFEEIQNEN